MKKKFKKVSSVFLSFLLMLLLIPSGPTLAQDLSLSLNSPTYTLQDNTSVSPWAPNTAYAQNTIVSYNGKNYECRQAHTSLLGWEPPNVPALWLEYNGSITPIETVETPTFTPAAGTYTSTQSVTMACATSGATIRYTIDGSEPTSDSTIYSSPINVSTTTTLKAKAFKTGMNASTTVSATYTIEAAPIETVSAPIISPNGGTFTSSQSVTITCTTSGATIRYTTDGTEPTTNSTIYSNPINVSTTTTIKAKAFKSDMNDSPTTSVTYTIQIAPVETVATPTFTPNGGTFTSSQSVTIVCTTSDATIRYTTNGAEPTANSTIYSGAINVGATTTVKAKAFKAGMNDSLTASATYTIQGAVVVKPWAPNTAYVKGDIVSYNGKNYECRQPHTSLLGWEPTNVPALWQEYSGSVTPIETVSNPTFTPAAGTYTSAQSVTLACATSGATIRYTTDGTEPTANSSVYSSAISVAKTTTLKAKAFKSGMNDSTPVSATYTIQITPAETVETPTFSPNGGTYTSNQSVTITCTTPGATIGYTTDGTEPNANSPVYSSTINVAKTTTLKAKAFKAGMNDSATVSATYTIGTTPISPLPKHILTGYWQNFDNGAKCLKISDVPTSYDLICVSFADATATPGAISFTLDPTLSSRLGGYTKEEFIQDIAAAKTKGQKVIISVGGEKGTIRVADATAATNFANSVYALMQEYGFDGVDIDLENGINATYMGSALRQLSAKAGPNLIITMAPQTIDMQSTGMEYFKLALSIKDILTVVNTQYYNSGAMLGQDGKVYSQGSVDFLTALAAIQLENGLRPDQVGLGLPASPSGAGGGYVNPTVVNTALNCLATGSKGGSYIPPNTYPDIRGAMTWSINWDASNGYNFANTIRPVLDALSNNTTPTKIATPTFSPVGGTYTSSQIVILSCATSGVTIRYTTNGTEPTSTSQVYTSPITLSTTTTLKAKAFKAGMTDSDTATATYTINPIGNTTLPKRLLIGYWHTWGGGPSGGVPFVKLRDVNPNWNVINISFTEPVSAGSTDGKMKFQVSGLTADYTINDFKADIKLLQSQGKKVVLSIGGYEGYFSLTSTAAVNQFVSDIKSFINEYGFDGIDIDLEQTSVTFNSGLDPDYKNPTSPKIVNMISAIRQICDAYGKDFILSWAPETYYMQLGYQYYGGLNANVDNRAGVYLPMIHALRDKTTYVHTQLYNSIVVTAPDGKTYSMGNAEATVAMCKMLLDGFNVGGKAEYFFEPLRADQVVIGVPASSSAAGSGHITNAQLQQAFDTLLTNYPNLRGIMTWSINWDAYQNNNSFAISNGQYLTSKQ